MSIVHTTVAAANINTKVSASYNWTDNILSAKQHIQDYMTVSCPKSHPCHLKGKRIANKVKVTFYFSKSLKFPELCRIKHILLRS